MPKAQANSTRLLRLKQAAEYLSVSPWTLRRVIQAGQIAFVQIVENGPWLVDRMDLDRFIESKKQTLE
jgi:excisionase family DNA binding protein